MTTAFVLTGGGSLGAVQVGMLQALHQHGIDPDLVIGTSVGAVNGAYLAGPGTIAERLANLTQLWVTLRRRDLFVADPRRWLGAALGSAPSLFPASPLRALLERHLGYATFEDARIPLHVTATDLTTGQGVVLSQGEVVTAVRASAAVPGLLPPQSWRGRVLVDGAVGGIDALDYANGQRPDDIYLLPAGYACAGPPATSALGTGLQALGLLLHRQVVRHVDRYSGPARLHVLPPLCPLSVSPADFSQSRALIAAAAESTTRWLERGDEVVASSKDLALHPDHDRGGSVPARRGEAA